ncbi:MAG: hypothetical protein LBN97_00725 [Oscillospiraceae bacterium]|jgi:hypothetical protein|nr:hypothetical protein [Oscillospiraceae bacterium]
MEKHTEQIRRFSKVIYILLKISFAAFIVVGAVEAVSWFMSVLALHTEAVIVGGKTIEVPFLFKLGEVKIYMPVFIMGESGADLSDFDFLKFSFGDFLRTAFTIAALAHAKISFRALRDNSSPFREDVVQKFKRLAIALLYVGVMTGVVGFLAAGIVWVLCLIFDYGCALQNESDTTL